MRFKHNLLTKIEIDRLTRRVRKTIGSYESGLKVDKASMRQLLAYAGYDKRQERDLELYLAPDFAQRGRILVLDNELACYESTVDDVAMRKSPTVKEMVKIRNIVKILSDKDVVRTKKEASLEALRREAVARLDLSYTESDIDTIVADGQTALARELADGVTECLVLFAELLGYGPPPKALRLSQHVIIGAAARRESGESVYGPMALYGKIHNTLKWIEAPVGSGDPAEIERMQQIGSGHRKADLENAAVLEELKRRVLAQGYDPGDSPA